jgi:hypothetical protein
MITRIGEAKEPTQLGDIVEFFAECKALSLALGLKHPPIESVEFDIPEDQAWIPVPPPPHAVTGLKGHAPKSFCWRIWDPFGQRLTDIGVSRPASFTFNNKKYDWDPMCDMDRSRTKDAMTLVFGRWQRFLDGLPSEAEAQRSGRPVSMRRRRTLGVRPLTLKQKRAGELWEQHHKVMLVATAMGITRQAAQQHLERYWKACPESAPTKRQPNKTQQLPTDQRGQVIAQARR